jgi:hypothetical protein
MARRIAIAAVCHPDAAKHRALGGGFVEVERLRIELRRETLDVFGGDDDLRAFETHPKFQIVEPFDHRSLSVGRCRNSASSVTQSFAMRFNPPNLL